MNESIDVAACLRYCHEEMSCDQCPLKNEKNLCDHLEKFAADEIEKLRSQLAAEQESAMEARHTAHSLEQDNQRLQNAFETMRELAIHLADRNAFPCEYCANDSCCPHPHACPANGYYCFTPSIPTFS